MKEKKEQLACLPVISKFYLKQKCISDLGFFEVGRFDHPSDDIYSRYLSHVTDKESRPTAARKAYFDQRHPALYGAEVCS